MNEWREREGGREGSTLYERVPCGRQTKDAAATAGDANEAIQLQMQIHNLKIHNKSCSEHIASYRFAVMWKTSRRSQFIKSEDTTLLRSALPRPVLCPVLCLNMGLLKRHMEFMRAQGLRRCCALSGHTVSRNGKQKMTKKRQQRTKRSADSGVGCQAGEVGRGAEWRQGCLESFANLFKSGPLLNCCCCLFCWCCCHLAACNSFAC